MNTLTRNNTSTAFVNVANGLLLLSITISFQQSCLKMAILKYLHKAILKLHAQVIDIVCVLSHFICCYFRTLHYYLIEIYKKMQVTHCAKAKRLGEVTGITYTGRITFNSSNSPKRFI